MLDMPVTPWPVNKILSNLLKGKIRPTLILHSYCTVSTFNFNLFALAFLYRNTEFA
jgi:hypothetical protein